MGQERVTISHDGSHFAEAAKSEFFFKLKDLGELKTVQVKLMGITATQKCVLLILNKKKEQKEQTEKRIRGKIEQRATFLCLPSC